MISIKRLELLVVVSVEGEGVEGDPVRQFYSVVDPSTARVLFDFDPYLQSADNFPDRAAVVFAARDVRHGEPPKATKPPPTFSKCACGLDATPEMLAPGGSHYGHKGAA